MCIERTRCAPASGTAAVFLQNSGRADQRGVTLIELIVFIVVISVGLAGVLSVFNVVVKNSTDPLILKQAFAVADALLEEVLLKDFANPSGGYVPSLCPAPATCNRALFDDVQDYHYATFQDASNISGTAIFDPASRYQTKVEVTQPSMPGTAGLSVAVGDVHKVIVTVKAPDSTEYSVTGYRYNYD